MKMFEKSDLTKLYKPEPDSSGEDNGQVTIIGGSKLFHGAPILALKVASRVVDMVFFASPYKPLKAVVSRLKASLSSFIWIPWGEVDAYIEKSDAVLIGPGLMRFTSESQIPNDKFQISNDEEGSRTKEITERFLKRFPKKKWVIDAGSLQVMDADWIPENSILTPNRKEFEMLFDIKIQKSKVKMTSENVKILREKAKKYRCTVVLKGPETIVCSPHECMVVKGGNAGLTKGGTGDVLAGLTVSLLAKNDAFLAATSASYVVKSAADELSKKVGTNYNADDLTNQIPKTLRS